MKINTSQEHLDNLGMTLDEIYVEVKYLAKCFGQKYPRMFRMNMHSQDIDKVLYTSNVLKKIESCVGFKRHLKEYNKNNITDNN